jgi:DNA polymerase III epsilon subunit-like protein
MLPEFTAIHGLACWDVKDSPEFPEIWPELEQMLLSADCTANDEKSLAIAEKLASRH